jgi:hypothetical protein
MRDFDFNRHFDIDGMMYDNAIWLSVQARLPLKEFLKIVNKLELGQKEWGIFWDKIKTEETPEEEIECEIGNKTYFFSQEEFEVAKQILNNPNPEEVSNCCGAGVYTHNAKDHISRCMECKEFCGIIYNFN